MSVWIWIFKSWHWNCENSCIVTKLTVISVSSLVTVSILVRPQCEYSEALGKCHQGGMLVCLNWAAGWERARPGLHSAAGCVGPGMCGDSGEPALSATSTSCRAQRSHILWTSCRSHSASHPHPHCTRGKDFQKIHNNNDSIDGGVLYLWIIFFKYLKYAKILTQQSRQRSLSESDCLWLGRSRPSSPSAALLPPSVSYHQHTSSSPPHVFHRLGCTG